MQLRGLSHTNLDKLYLVYIRPLFEYACELWDNWGIGNWNNFNWKPPGLLQVYLFSQKLIFFYIETSWELLSMRRKRRKLQLFYNIVNKNTPNYLCTLIPPTMQSASVYPLRNGNDIILPFCRLCSY